MLFPFAYGLWTCLRIVLQAAHATNQHSGLNMYRLYQPEKLCSACPSTQRGILSELNGAAIFGAFTPRRAASFHQSRVRNRAVVTEPLCRVLVQPGLIPLRARLELQSQHLLRFEFGK